LRAQDIAKILRSEEYKLVVDLASKLLIKPLLAYHGDYEPEHKCHLDLEQLDLHPSAMQAMAIANLAKFIHPGSICYLDEWANKTMVASFMHTLIVTSKIIGAKANEGCEACYITELVSELRNAAFELRCILHEKYGVADNKLNWLKGENNDRRQNEDN
jgi:hypothetical protein